MFCAGAIAYVVYIPPFFLKYSFTSALFATFINILQVISLDADYLAFYDVIQQHLGTGLFADVYETLLAGVHFLLPIVSATTALTLIVRFFTQLQLTFLRRRKHPLYVFSEVNYKSIILASDIRKCDENSEILFLEENNDLDHSGIRESLHCTVLYERIENIKAHAKKRKVHYYCISQDQDKNLNAALTIISELQSEPKETQKNNYIFLFSKNSSVELMVDSIDKGLVEIDVINEYQNASYQLLQNHPLTHAARDGKIDVLLFGFSKLNQEFLRAASWCGQIYATTLSFTVIGIDAEKEFLDFKVQYPGLFTDRYDIRFFDCKDESEVVTTLNDHARHVNYIVVSEPSEEQTVDRAVFLRRFYYRIDASFTNLPHIYAYVENAEKAEAVSRLQTAEAKKERRMPYNIVPFGMATDIYTFANITDSDLEKLAKNVHLVYEDIFSDTEIDALEAITRYNLFEVNKRSNRANALHIRYKLSMLGLDYTDDPDAQEVELRDYLSDDMLEKLTYAEHDRWMAFLESEGWITATIEEVNAYKASGISKGRHNCPLLKMHPYICPFEELQERSDQLGLPDSTVYDRELIARITDILHDRWGVAGKKYKIVKK